MKKVGMLGSCGEMKFTTVHFTSRCRRLNNVAIFPSLLLPLSRHLAAAAALRALAGSARMGSDLRWWWSPWPPPSSPRRRVGGVGGGGHVLVKVLASFLLAGISLRLLCSLSSSASPSPAIMKGRCNIFNGQWMPNPSGPAYTNASCRFIDDHQNCMLNGRPDTGYLHWRWKPHGCDLPPFDAEKFLGAMRNKSWGLIGDSILRNQVQSLICLLSQAEEPVEVYHDKDFKSRRWHFQSHKFTVSILWSPFLVKSDVFENENGESTSEIQLHLDALDTSWTNQYESFDYIVIAGGQWFLKTAVYRENGKAIGCHYCRDKNLTELGFEHLYQRTLREVFSFITSSRHKPVVIFRTWAPDHFENGQWFNGGTCNRTVPYKNGEYSGGRTDHVMRGIELEEFDNAVAALNRSESAANLRLLDTYNLSSLRPDGHVGSYRMFHPFTEGRKKATGVQNDCLHWCVPGPIDAWNDLVVRLVLNR